MGRFARLLPVHPLAGMHVLLMLILICDAAADVDVGAVQIGGDVVYLRAAEDQSRHKVSYCRARRSGAENCKEAAERFRVSGKAAQPSPFASHSRSPSGCTSGCWGNGPDSH